MKCIGFDKRDMGFRHFYFDDSEFSASNPPKYKVWYVDDESDIDYIDCRYVMRIKSVDEQKTTTIQPQTEIKIELPSKQSDTILDDDIYSKSNENVISVPIEITNENPKTKKTTPKAEEPKKRGRKKKETKSLDNSNKAVSQPVDPSDYVRPYHTYEYNVTEFECVSIDEIMKQLNKYGENGWELVNTDISIGGMFTSKKRIICIMKRVKD